MPWEVGAFRRDEYAGYLLRAGAAVHRPATLFACRAWVPIIFSLSLLCSKMCSTGKPKERFLVATSKLGLTFTKSRVFRR